MSRVVLSIAVAAAVLSAGGGSQPPSRQRQPWLGGLDFAACAMSVAQAAPSPAQATVAQPEILLAHLGSSVEAKDFPGAIRMVFREALQTLNRGGGIEEAWYVAARSAELARELGIGETLFPATIQGRSFRTLAELTGMAVAQAPSSARIATVDVWATLDVGKAAKAIKRFPKHLPLRVALARAQLAAEDAAGSLQTLLDVPHLETIPRGMTVLSAARLANGDPRGALAALKVREPTPAFLDFESELDARSRALRRERLETLYRAQLALNRPREAIRPLLDAAEMGSAEARRMLKEMEPRLEEAFRAAAKKGTLTEFDRQFLRDIRH
jgi:hypothetical protein